jgi:hypothetical protein
VNQPGGSRVLAHKDLESSCKYRKILRQNSRMDRISRPLNSAGNYTYITGKLMVILKMVVLELIDRCSSRVTCILKENLCMFSYRFSEKQ